MCYLSILLYTNDPRDIFLLPTFCISWNIAEFVDRWSGSVGGEIPNIVASSTVAGQSATASSEFYQQDVIQGILLFQTPNTMVKFIKAGKVSKP